MHAHQHTNYCYVHIKANTNGGNYLHYKKHRKSSDVNKETTIEDTKGGVQHGSLKYELRGSVSLLWHMLSQTHTNLQEKIHKRQ